MKQINDSSARLAYLNEKAADLNEALGKAEKLKSQQAEHLAELKERTTKIE